MKKTIVLCITWVLCLSCYRQSDIQYYASICLTNNSSGIIEYKRDFYVTNKGGEYREMPGTSTIRPGSSTQILFWECDYRITTYEELMALISSVSSDARITIYHTDRSNETLNCMLTELPKYLTMHEQTNEMQEWNHAPRYEYFVFFDLEKE